MRVQFITLQRRSEKGSYVQFLKDFLTNTKLNQLYGPVEGSLSFLLSTVSKSVYKERPGHFLIGLYRAAMMLPTRIQNFTFPIVTPYLPKISKNDLKLQYLFMNTQVTTKLFWQPQTLELHCLTQCSK